MKDEALAGADFWCIDADAQVTNDSSFICARDFSRLMQSKLESKLGSFPPLSPARRNRCLAPRYICGINVARIGKTAPNRRCWPVQGHPTC